MKEREFDKLAIELFGSVLQPEGFSNSGSAFCVFHRKVNDEIYHVVMPDFGSRGVWFDVKVAPVSPCLDPKFESRFPDSVGLFTRHYLNKYEGVGARQQQFNCKYEENMRRVFSKEVEPLLKGNALPYLDQITSLADMLPLITHDLGRGLALHHLGKKAEALPLLRAERERLAAVDGAEDTVSHLDALLAAG